MTEIIVKVIVHGKQKKNKQEIEEQNIIFQKNINDYLYRIYVRKIELIEELFIID
jgi:hypothetical protein